VAMNFTKYHGFPLLSARVMSFRSLSVAPNPFIERTSCGRLRLSAAAAHVER
jgi:hypothetical protein